MQAMDDINDCVYRAQAGDPGAFEEIVRRFQATAFSLAFAALGDSHLAEDAVQEAFVEAYRKLGSLRAPEAFTTWFRRIVRTACNRMTRRKRREVTSLEEAAVDDMPSGDQPSDGLERRERDHLVHVAVQALPDSLRTVTALYFLGDLRQAAMRRTRTCGHSLP